MAILTSDKPGRSCCDLIPEIKRSGRSKKRKTLVPRRVTGDTPPPPPRTLWLFGVTRGLLAWKHRVKYVFLSVRGAIANVTRIQGMSTIFDDYHPSGTCLPSTIRVRTFLFILIINYIVSQARPDRKITYTRRKYEVNKIRRVISKKISLKMYWVERIDL